VQGDEIRSSTAAKNPGSTAPIEDVEGGRAELRRGLLRLRPGVPLDDVAHGALIEKPTAIATPSRGSGDPRPAILVRLRPIRVAWHAHGRAGDRRVHVLRLSRHAAPIVPASPELCGGAAVEVEVDLDPAAIAVLLPGPLPQRSPIGGRVGGAVEYIVNETYTVDLAAYYTDFYPLPGFEKSQGEFEAFLGPVIN
jgi:hypothetical protein